MHKNIKKVWGTHEKNASSSGYEGISEISNILG